MRKAKQELPPTSDTMKKLDEILTSTLEVLAMLKGIRKEREVVLYGKKQKRQQRASIEVRRNTVK